MFSASGISFGAVPLRHPQTEHLLFNIPLPLGFFSAPFVNGGVSVDGKLSYYPAGTIELEPGKIDAKVYRLNVEGGDRKFFRSDAFLHDYYKSEKGLQIGWGAAGKYQEIERMDYEDNYLKLWNGSGRLQIKGDEGRFDVISGIGRNEFGARGYYGAPVKYPAMENVDDNIILVSAELGDREDSFLRFSSVYRSQKDTYLLDRFNPSFYKNIHHTDASAAGADGLLGLTSNMKFLYRVVAEYEKLDSSNLGKHDRSRGEGSISLAYDGFNPAVNAGFRVQMFEEEKSALNPFLLIRTTHNEEGYFYASYSALKREPSYTELYYHSIANKGNPDLSYSESHSVFLGYRMEKKGMFSADTGTFARKENHSVDWLWNTNSTKWEATDVGEVDTYGMWAGTALFYNDFLIKGTYSFLHKESDYNFYASRYMFDYPEHLFHFSVAWRLMKRVSLSFAQAIRYQTLNPERTSNRTGKGAEAGIIWQPTGNEAVQVKLLCENLWNDDFQFLPGQKPVSRLVSLGLTVAW